MNQQVSFLKEKKESIRKATLGAINQARDKKRIAIEDAYTQENETCRAALEAVEELKKKPMQIEDIRILLLGGSSDSGLQVVELAQKPIPLIEKVVKLAQVEVTSYTTREIYLKHRADLPN
ncbi:MAG: hypothetical protein WC231_07610 [Dehalococcoidales bacterium]|jgi:hypothetical protein|nr:hypothetical protein [Dehalococcoidales bacterium]MDD5605295.1 hypothetical protein [Dehalococcoidales bacterium]MDX9985846.1 hypothetical protein [Dehalococcoidales bacterium]NLE89431.1 hypothetical protein [Dehalococcoidales bacterium]